MVSDEEREQLVLQAMEDLGVSRQEAEHVIGIELGEIPGDEIAVDDGPAAAA